MRMPIPIEESQLYGLKRKFKLEAMLGMPHGYLLKPIGLDYQYKSFSETKKDGVSQRTFSYPAKGSELKKYQQKLFQLLNQIIIPEWVKSSQKGESYITNASAHKEFPYGMKLDIASFYDNASFKRIRMCFRNAFQMEPDIAEIVARLLTYQKGTSRGVPTGGAASMRLMYFTYQDMFHRIYDISSQKGIVFTVYVDDLSFSAHQPISREFYAEVKKIVRSYGLTINDKKTEFYGFNQYRCYTGVGIHNGKLKVPNHLRKEIIDLLEVCKRNNNIKDIIKLQGKVNSARQIEPGIFPGIYSYIKGRVAEIDKYDSVANRNNRKRKRVINQTEQFKNGRD